MKEFPKKIAISGGVSNGKTSLIKYIEQQGYVVVPEVSRNIINTNTAIDSDILPWKNVDAFEKACFKGQIFAEKKINSLDTEFVFLDRCMVDLASFYQVRNVPVPKNVWKHIEKSDYYFIFCLEPLTSFEKDKIRIEDEITAKKLYEVNLENCNKYFPKKTITLPPVSIQARYNIIIQTINNRQA